MSTPLDPAFEAAHDVLFAVFAESAHVRRGRGRTVPVRVVITYNVGELGDYSQGAARVTTAKFLNTEWRARAGDRLQLSSGAHRVDRVVVDDGIVTETVLHG